MSFPVFHPVYNLCSGLEVVLNWSMLNFLECFIVLPMGSQCANCDGYLGPAPQKNLHLKKTAVFFWYKSESSIQEAQEDVCAARLDDDPGFSVLLFCIRLQ